MSATNPMAPADPIQLKKKRKVCQICGAQYVPTSNVQKYCPECRQQMQKDGSVKESFVKYRQARQCSPVTSYNMETPEQKTIQPETPEQPAIDDSYLMLQKAVDLPDGLATIEEYAEVFRRWVRGELVDKNEFLAQIRERLGEL